MPINTKCPHCGTPYTLTDQQAGKKVRCRECKAAFIVSGRGPARQVEAFDVDVVEDEAPVKSRPRPAPAAAVTTRRAAPAPSRRRAEEDEEDRPRRRRRQSSGGAGKWILLGAVGFLTVLFIIGALTLYLVLRKGKGDTVASAPRFTNQVNFGGNLSGPAASVENPASAEPPPPVVAAPLDVGPSGGSKPIEPEPVAPETSPAPRRPRRPVEEDLAPEPVTHDGTISHATRQRVTLATVYIEVMLADGTQASGSGFFGVTGAPNLVLTNAHVVGMLAPDSKPPKTVEVYLNSGEPDERKLTAQVVGVDRASDLAVLDVGGAPDLPKPLRVKSARSLQPLDRLYTFGFPLGKSLGKAITIRETKVSALRKGKNGELHRIQIEGGLDQGSSGGPLVDPTGAVVGVAVAVIRGHQIHFAIPGDHVHGLLNGRLSAMEIHQSYYTEDGRVAFPVDLQMIDPRNQIREVSLDVWTGKEPPASRRVRSVPDGMPTTEPGDSRRLRAKLAYDHRTAHGEVLLPVLHAGQAYWIQPHWKSVDGEDRWDVARVWSPPADAPPVMRRPSTLFLNARAPGGPRDLTVTWNNTFRVSLAEADDEDIPLQFRLRAVIQERPATFGGGLTLNMQFKELNHVAVLDRKETPDPHLNQIRDIVPFIKAQLRLDVRGEITSYAVDQHSVVARSNAVTAGPRWQAVEHLTTPIWHGLRTLAVPLPGKQVRPQDSWKATRPMLLEVPSEEFSNHGQSQLNLTYTYVGQRKSAAGRDEAVVSIEGQMVDGSVSNDVKTGANRASGTALIDVATGQVTQARIAVTLEIRAQLKTDEGIKPIRVICIQETRLERRL